MVEGKVTAAAASTSFNTRCFLPETGPGPFPLVTFAHGFQLPISQYVVSATHLAGFGFVVCLPDFQAGMFNPNHAKNALEIMATIDWATAPSSPVGVKVDPSRVGATGHSLGGKVSVIAAAQDSRIRAVLGIDPVDAATMCNPTNCPDASDLLPLPIPTAFVGETLDAAGGFQPCAPAADNFETFFARAGTPSLKVHVEGANHMSFLDDPATCGTQCSFCKPPTRDHAEVIGLTRAYLAAFFLRHLGGNAAWDDYLDGSKAKQRYVQTGIAAVDSK
jgi:predicted dienelactone hydrolase